MKKFLFATLMVMMGVCAQAQIVSSSSSRVIRFVENKPATLFEPNYYIKGGLSVLSFTGGSSFYSLAGYNLVFGYDKPFLQDKTDVPLRGCISWGIEAGLSSRGTGIEFRYYWADILKHSLIINPKLTFKVGSPKFSWYYDAGVFLSADYASSIDADDDDTESIFYSLTEGQNVDAGVSVGTGFWINRFEIGLSALFGFVPLFDTGDDFGFDGNNMSVQFHIGWAF